MKRRLPRRALRLGSRVRRFGGPSFSGAPASPLARGAAPGNLDLTAPGRVRLALWNEWQGMLEGAARLGPLWRVARNRHASLGLREERGYPALRFSPHGDLAVDAGGTCSAEFAFWRRAWAVDAACAGARLHAAEFEDFDGEVFHKICLGEGADLGRFVAWAQAHQATGLEGSRPVRPAPAPPSRPALGVLHVAVERLRALLLTAAEREIPLLCTVFHPGLRQSGRLRIAGAAEAGGWLRLSGEGAALFVETEPAALLRVEPRPVEGEASWRVSLADPDGRRWVEFRAEVDDLPAWNRAVAETLLAAPRVG